MAASCTNKEIAGTLQGFFAYSVSFCVTYQGDAIGASVDFADIRENEDMKASQIDLRNTDVEVSDAGLFRSIFRALGKDYINI